MKMKMFVLSVVLLSTFAAVQNEASAYWRHYYRPYYPHRYYRCSPEMTQNSTSIVQKILADAAASPDFASASTFQDFVTNTSSMVNASDKMHAYLGSVGVDSNDANAIAEFMGARDHSTYVVAAEKNLGLTQAQADFLVSKVTSALLNLTTGLKN